MNAARAVRDALAQRTFCVELVQGRNAHGMEVYAYVAIRTDRREQFLQKLSNGQVVLEDEGVVISKGYGKHPPYEVRREVMQMFSLDAAEMVH